MSKAVVLARSIKPEWLDKAVEVVLEGNTGDEITNSLNAYLARYIGSSINVRKTREILISTWVDTDSSIPSFRQKALDLFLKSGQSERLAIHWAMMLLAFPFFRDLCSIIGKLAGMQEEVLLSQIKRRVFEIWGERSTLVHSIPKNIKTMRDFGVLETIRPGVYRVIGRRICDKAVACLLIEAVFRTSDKLYHRVSDINKFGVLFPFIINVGIDDINNQNDFLLDRIGGETVVGVREEV